VALAVTLLVATCQPSSASPGSTPITAPASPVGAPGSPGGSGSPGPSGALVVDASLLDVLPETVDGIAVLPAAETAARLLDDADLGRSASAVAVGLAIDVDDPTGEFAVATVVRTRPGVMDDAYDEQWRADYDAAACEPAGGVDTHDRTTLGGHAVETTACVDGARTYHARLADDVLVSITEVGQRRLGERMMAGLRG
jgi:hypothetical protein